MFSGCSAGGYGVQCLTGLEAVRLLDTSRNRLFSGNYLKGLGGHQQGSRG